MTQIDPFPGYRYTVSTGEQLALRLSPPYDRIPSDLHKELWDLNSQNAVRVILPPPEGGGTDPMTQSVKNQEWYEQASKRFHGWIESGAISPDAPSIYLYRQVFELDGIVRERWGFFAALKLDPDKRALAHEKTFDGPKADRFRLISACKANLSPIFVLYDDTVRLLPQIANLCTKVAVTCKTSDGIQHDLYLIHDENIIRQLQELLEPQQVYIADGHHRYETALNYLEAQRKEGKLQSNDPAYWTMAYFCPIQDPGLTILPTHRLVSNLPDGWFERLTGSLGDLWTVALFDDNLECITAQKSVPLDQIGIVVSNGTQQALLAAIKAEVAQQLSNHPEPLRQLNVVVLHDLILGRVLGLTDTQPGQIRYIKGAAETLAQLHSDPGSAAGTVGAFLLRPVSVEEVRQASAQGCRMPPKSTDFFPKLPTGLVYRLLQNLS